MEKNNILLVEDNEELNAINNRALVKKGYNVLTAKTLKQARELLGENNVEVILLDVMLPDGDGIEFCKEIRAATDAHILFLTASVQHEQRVRGLDVGGDDYITKPYSLDELLSRVASAMRRRTMTGMPSNNTMAFGSLTLDVVAGTALVGGRDLLLSTKEFAVLYLLASNEGKVLSAKELYEKAWKRPMINDKRPLWTRISGLRKKMSDAGCEYTISSVYSSGYRFERV